VPSGQSQQVAQREIVSGLKDALDARRERIVISRSEVSWIKWVVLYLQAACVLIVIALVQSDNRLASAIAMGVFATGLAASALLILSYERPFAGQFSIRPDPLLDVAPEVQ
jgi:hypothetical protein